MKYIGTSVLGKGKWLFGLGCLLPTLGQGFVSDDGLSRNTGLMGKDKIGFERNLKEVYALDRQSALKEDLPEKVIKKTGTDKLLLHFLKTSIPTVTFLLYDDPNIGIYRASRSCSSLQEILKRKDLAATMILFFTNFEVDPARNKDFSDAGELSLAFINVELLCNYPDVISKCAGKERVLLTLLSKKYAEIKAIDKRLGATELVYGNAAYFDSSCLAIGFVNRIDHASVPALKKLLSESKFDDIFAWVDQYLKRR